MGNAISGLCIGYGLVAVAAAITITVSPVSSSASPKGADFLAVVAWPLYVSALASQELKKKPKQKEQNDA